MTLSFLIENDLNKASVTLAIKSITDKLQNIAENVARIEVNDLMPILDNMQESFGAELTKQFNEDASGKVREIVETLKTAKEVLTAYVAKMEGSINGDGDINDMSIDTAFDFGDEEVADDFEAETSDDIDSFDDDEVEDVAPVADQRVRKESVERNVKALSEAANPDQLIYKTFTKIMESTTNVKEACSLVAEAYAIEFSDVVDIVKEGRTWSKNPNSDNYKNNTQRKDAKFAQQSRKKDKFKDEELEEGRTWSKNPNSDNYKSKDQRDKAKFAQQSRKKDKFDDEELEEGRSWSNNPNSDNYKNKDQKTKAKFAQKDRKKDKFADDAEINESFGKRGVDNAQSSAASRNVVPVKQLYRQYIDKATTEEAEKAAADDFRKFVNKNVETLYVFGFSNGDTEQYNSKNGQPFIVKVLNDDQLIDTWDGDMLLPRYRVTIVDGKGIIPDGITTGVIHGPQYRVQRK